MDLGISGRKAIVCASSQGLGRGCAFALAKEGVHVYVNGRTAASVEAAAATIRAETGGEATGVVADVTTPGGRRVLMEACPEPDILINNAGGPPARDFRELREADWIAGVQANMIAPIMLMQMTVDGMASRGFGRVVNITSRSVKTPLAHLPLSNGARAGLTGFVAGLAREVARNGVIINNLLPGPFETERQVRSLRQRAAKEGIDYEAFREAQHAAVPVRRHGTPEEFGAACAFLCSVHAGFIVGQNILLDGGGFQSTV